MNDAACLIDIARHFAVVDNLAPVKVAFEQNRVVAEAMNGVYDIQSCAAARLSGRTDGIATVMCYGQLDVHVSSMANVVCIPDPVDLRDFADLFPGAAPQVTRYPQASAGDWLQVEFCGEDGETAHAMLQSARVADALVNVPSFTTRSPDTSFSPTTSVVKLMKTLFNKAKQRDVDRFWPIMNKRGRLYFSFDFTPSAAQPATFEVSAGLPYCQLQPHAYDAESVLKVLALADQSRPAVVSLFNAGVLVVDIVSALGGRYKYVFIGTSELISDAQRAHDLVKQLALGNGEDVSMYVDWEPDL